MRIDVDCSSGEPLRLGVVMAGEASRELGARLGAGSIVRVTGSLRAVRGRLKPGGAAGGVEVIASEISEIPGRRDR